MTTVLHRAPVTDARVQRRERPFPVPAAAVVVVVGAAACFATIGRASFDLDESVSASLARAPWHVFTHTVTTREANMALYYLLLRVWGVFGHSEAAVRSLSALAGVGALAVLLVLTRRLFDRRTALVCGVLFALDPVVVLFAQDARGYALSLLLVTGSSALFVRGVRDRSGSDAWVWPAYVLLSALAAYANFWAALVPLGHAVSLAFLPRRSVPWRRLVPSATGLLVLLVPLGLLIHSTDNSGVNWAAGSSAGRVFSDVRSHLPHALIDVAVVALVAAVAALVAYARRHPFFTRAENWPTAFVVCWLVVPVAAVILLSLVYKPLLVVRYLVVVLPPLFVLVALALSRLRAVRVVAAGVAALVVVSVGGLVALDAHGSSQDWRGAAAALSARARPGDGVVVFAPYTRTPFEWYLRDHPAAEARLHPLFPSGAWGGNLLGYDTSIPVTESAIARVTTGYRRVWLVQSQQGLYPSEESALLAGLRAAGLSSRATLSFHGVEVDEYTPSSS
jgi:mannosyltransferase